MTEPFAKIFLRAHFSSARQNNLGTGRLHQARRGGDSICYNFEDDFEPGYPSKVQAVFDREYKYSPPQDLALLAIDPVDDPMLKNYLKTAEDELGEFAIDLPNSSKPIFHYKEITGVMRYTLILPSRSGIYLQLFEKVNTLPSEKTPISGLCYGIFNSDIKEALGLPPYYRGEELGIDNQPNRPIIAAEVIVSLLSFFGRKINPQDELKSQFNNIEYIKSSLKSDQRPKNLTPRDLRAITEELFGTRDGLNSAFTDGESVIACLKSVYAHLDEQRGHTDKESQVFKENAALLKPISKIMESRLAELNKLGRTMDELFHTVRDLKDEQKDRMQEILIELTNALRTDSANMKIIAVLTAFFLPFTYMAILLTTPMFKWPDPREGEIIIWLPFRIYWAASGGMTLLLLLWGIWLFRPVVLFGPKKIVYDEEGKIVKPRTRELGVFNMTFWKRVLEG